MCLAPVLTTAKEFENGGFTLKMRIMSSTNTAPKDFKKHNNYRSFWICVWGKTRSEKSRDYCEAIVFKQLPCVSRKHENETAGEFKYLWLNERFQKASFLWWISVDGRPINSWNEAAFSNFSVVEWPLLQIIVMTFSTSLGANSSMNSADSLGGNVPIFGVILNTPWSSRVRVTCDDVTEGSTGTPGGTGHSKNGL